MRNNSSCQNEIGYPLELADLGAWWLRASPQWQYWLDRLAGFLELEPGPRDGRPAMVFGSEGEFFPSNAAAPEKDDSWPWGLCELKSFRFAVRPGTAEIFCEIRPRPGDHQFDSEMIDVIKMRYIVYPFYLMAIQNGGLPIHGALFEREGRVVLLAASGNTGKSTCCERLPEPWKPLADDAVLVVKTKEGYRAHPFPTWNDHVKKRADTRWDVQKSYPLDAIFFLEQAAVDSVVPLGQAETTLGLNDAALEGIIAIRAMIGQEWLRRFWLQVLDNSSTMARTLPAYILRVSLTGQFWKEMEKVL